MKKIITIFCTMLFIAAAFSQSKTIVLSKEKLRDKIKGGRAGQTIGVTFGGPYEFQFNGTFIGIRCEPLDLRLRQPVARIRWRSSNRKTY